MHPATGCSALNISGSWVQSVACFSEAGQCCERTDNDAFTIQGNCDGISATVLSTFLGVWLTGEPNTLNWSGSETHTDSTQDYGEFGVWTFQDAAHFTATSSYTYYGHPGGGSCVANGAKGAVPLPVTDPTACTGKPVCGP